ncbi:MAG TPA: isoamylase [Candidatus Binataceae bacterium]|nr:isoamylase [Candidatus Binataceae bacterium]
MKGKRPMLEWYRIEGTPHIPGAIWIDEERAYNFTLYSRQATGVTLLFYGDNDLFNPLARIALDYLKNKSGRVWHCRVPAGEIAGARYYAYSVDGPFQPQNGDRFDSQKVLLDPYARKIFFPPGFSRDASRGSGSNAGKAPLAVLPDRGGLPAWDDDPRPRHTHDTIIYEMHVRGFTMGENSGVSAPARGRFAGVIEKIPYLKELGVTVVELLPVFQFDPDEGNYWGYMPLGFFAPHHGYTGSGDGDAREFRAMVAALHAAGIEVVLDVVYNHTTEEDENGPTYSFRGIDNSTYYLLEADMSHYRDDTGTGNVLRSAHPKVRKLILDSMRRWVREMHVDGFRFDLASIFTRRDDGSIDLGEPAVIANISGDEDFADIRLIAEPWDLNSYELGRSFPGHMWSQWNGKFRDEVRAFVKGDNGKVGALMSRIYGSADLFPDDRADAYHPYQSVNLITAHDGFCLYDLVAYNSKHNEANGQNNQDGTDYNLSWNCGWEGDVDVPAGVMELRKQQIKNFCCLLLLANGTPMFCAGDEFMNTQGGNNNPYNQDNHITWLNWDRLERNRDVFRFFKSMIAFRKAHPSLGRSRFWRDDVSWYGVGKDVDLSDTSHTLAFCVRGAAQQDEDIYVMVNAYWENLDFTVQEGQAGEWKRVVDTSLASPFDFAAPGSEPTLTSMVYTVKARSVVVLLRAG